MHFLFILKDADNLNTQFSIDQIACTEISNLNTKGFVQKLYKVISNFIIYNPCREHNLNAGNTTQCRVVS
jgi:hypothetical protein